nr:leucine-rich melanocyte differentiation-associated protein-like isoform X2 [Onthophagus taurus]
MDNEELSASDSYQIFDIRDVPGFFCVGESSYEGFRNTMTSLRSLMLLNDSSNVEDSSISRRLSLAYERLHSMPKILQRQLAPGIQILDISNNEFEKLDFLEDFNELTTLICDHNLISSDTEIPFLPKLELLWLNHCKIQNLYPWANKLQQSCPNLKFLSLMGNPAAPSYFNGGNFYDYLQYRYFIISLFPNLIHLDDRVVTDDQREEAQKLYKRPFYEQLITRTSLPMCLRSVKNKVQNIFSTTPQFTQNRNKNCVI